MRNAINPTGGDLSLASIDSVKMKYPEIFEVKASLPSLKVSKKTTSAQTDGIFDMNGSTHINNLR